MSSGNSNQNQSPPKPTVNVHPAVAGTVSISAVLATVLLGLQSFGVISPSTGDTANKVLMQLTPVIQQLQDKIENKTNPPAPVVVPVNVNPAPVTPVNPKPAPSPSPTPAVATIDDVLLLVQQVLQTIQKNPAPLPVPIVNPPSPVPSPNPIATIVATDSNGKTLPLDGSRAFSMIDPGKQFSISSTGTVHAGASASLTWTLLKSSPDDVDAVAFPDGSGYAVTMRNGATLSAVLSAAQNASVATQSLIVKCNQAPQPPPQPIPTVTPKPTPTPTPTPVPLTVNPPAPIPDATPDKPKTLPTDLRVIIVFDPAQTHTREQLNLLNSTTIISALNSKCIKDAASGTASWRRWTPNMDVSKDPSPDMKSLYAKGLPEAKSEGLPAIVIACGGKAVAHQLKGSDSDVIALLNCGT